MADNKTHHCFNCGTEASDYDELPNGRKLYICDDKRCAREFIETCRDIQAEAEERAKEDGHSRYY